MKLSKTIKLPHYECVVTLIITDDIVKEISRIYKKHKIESDIDFCAAVTIPIPDDLSVYYVVINDKYLLYNTIGHELWHLVGVILEDRDESVSYSCESCAYLQGFFLEEFMKFAHNKKLEVK